MKSLHDDGVREERHKDGQMVDRHRDGQMVDRHRDGQMEKQTSRSILQCMWSVCGPSELSTLDQIYKLNPPQKNAPTPPLHLEGLLFSTHIVNVLRFYFSLSFCSHL